MLLMAAERKPWQITGPLSKLDEKIDPAVLTVGLEITAFPKDSSERKLLPRI